MELANPVIYRVAVSQSGLWLRWTEARSRNYEGYHCETNDFRLFVDGIFYYPKTVFIHTRMNGRPIYEQVRWWTIYIRVFYCFLSASQNCLYSTVHHLVYICLYVMVIFTF